MSFLLKMAIPHRWQCCDRFREQAGKAGDKFGIRSLASGQQQVRASVCVHVSACGGVMFVSVCLCGVCGLFLLWSGTHFSQNEAMGPSLNSWCWSYCPESWSGGIVINCFTGATVHWMETNFSNWWLQNVGCISVESKQDLLLAVMHVFHGSRSIRIL